jgi:hypothetical protein
MTEESSERPALETLRMIAKDRGIAISEDRLEAARQMHSKFRPELDRLRQVELEFLPPYIEPATALQWIENGGRLP